MTGLNRRRESLSKFEIHLTFSFRPSFSFKLSDIWHLQSTESTWSIRKVVVSDATFGAKTYYSAKFIVGLTVSRIKSMRSALHREGKAGKKRNVSSPTTPAIVDLQSRGIVRTDVGGRAETIRRLFQTLPDIPVHNAVTEPSPQEIVLASKKIHESPNRSWISGCINDNVNVNVNAKPLEVGRTRWLCIARRGRVQQVVASSLPSGATSFGSTSFYEIVSM
eukprot:jgi/Psemu1/38262/gm1.38262_g